MSAAASARYVPPATHGIRLAQPFLGEEVAERAHRHQTLLDRRVRQPPDSIETTFVPRRCGCDISSRTNTPTCVRPAEARLAAETAIDRVRDKFGPQDAAATRKKTFGHHPLMGFVDHGRGGSGEPVVGLLRPGNAGSNTAADRIEATRLALAQLPKRLRRGRQTLNRTDSGGTHEFVAWLAQRGRWLSYSVGMTITEANQQAVLKVPASGWTPAVEPDGDLRDGAWVAELDGDCL